MSDDADKKGENGKRGRGITIKLDGSMITALVALLTAGGVGIYGSTMRVGEWEIRETRTGTAILVNDVNRRAASRDRKIFRIVTRQKQEIADLYYAMDWMAAALATMGKKHPSTWRRLSRHAPDHILDFKFPSEVDTASAVTVEDRSPGAMPRSDVRMESKAAPPVEAEMAIDDEVDLLEEIEAEPEPIEFPDNQMIQRKQDTEP